MSDADEQTGTLVRPACARSALQSCFEGLTAQGPQEHVIWVPTLHNWVEQVYTDLGHVLPTASGELALLGVREATIVTSRTVPTPARRGKPAGRGPDTDPNRRDVDAVADGVGETTFEPTARDSTRGWKQNVFNDLLFCVWTEGVGPTERQMVEVYVCTVDPSFCEDVNGLPFLLEGHRYQVKKTQHGGHPALRIYTPGAEADHITILRNAGTLMAGGDLRLVFTDVKQAWPPKSAARTDFVRDEQNTTFHMHYSSDDAVIPTAPVLVGDWSSGCTVLRHAPSHARYKAFMKRCYSAKNAGDIPYVVASSAYLKLYDDWVTDEWLKLRKIKQLLARLLPPRVVQQGQLRAHPRERSLSLPSVLTSEFAANILTMADDLDAAANDRAKQAALATAYPGLPVKLARATPDQLRGYAVTLRSSLRQACFRFAGATTSVRSS